MWYVPCFKGYTLEGFSIIIIILTGCVFIGDERPCQRCIKRGFQDACHDGVRKKAKYLHDAPNEALMPNIGGAAYNQRHPNRGSVSQSINGVNSSPKAPPQSTPPAFFPSQQPPDFSNYAQSEGSIVQAQQLQDSTVHSDAFASQSPVSPTFRIPQNVHSKNFPASLTQPSNPTPSAPGQGQSQFGSAFFDPSDPALFNFDIASMNFGNHYGALEFGMLGHMATGVGDTPPSDTATQRGSIGRSGSGTFGISGAPASNFGESPTNQPPFLFGEPGVNDWTQSTPVNTRNLYGQQSMIGAVPDKPHAFAIESAPANFASPKSTESPLTTANAIAFDDNSASAFNTRHNMAGIAPQRQQPLVSTSQLKQQAFNLGNKRRHRKPSAIYDSVKEPYSYTSGFHSLTAFVQRRFTPQKTLRIAKALASIRPSFIATTKTLNRDDLIFMEKCFQRTLWEYEDFINACGTPTIVCRRTGEIAAVGKEFSILTGWKKEVLLGKEPNLNVNTGGSSGSVTGTTSRGSYTPRPGGNQENQNAVGAPRTQPVFLAELLDDNSVVEFYEDFAKLAFGDSRGSVMTTCKLLKYKTKEDTQIIPGGNGEDPSSNGGSPTANNGDVVNGYNNGTAGTENGNGNGGIDGVASNGQQQQNSQTVRQKWVRGGIAGEAGMNQLGFRDGKVECSYCWTVKRDVFDIPMLIVMNVSSSFTIFTWRVL